MMNRRASSVRAADFDVSAFPRASQAVALELHTAFQFATASWHAALLSFTRVTGCRLSTRCAAAA